jgi:hypothetical protein
VGGERGGGPSPTVTTKGHLLRLGESSCSDKTALASRIPLTALEFFSSSLFNCTAVSDNYSSTGNVHLRVELVVSAVVSLHLVEICFSRLTCLDIFEQQTKVSKEIKDIHKSKDYISLSYNSSLYYLYWIKKALVNGLVLLYFYFLQSRELYFSFFVTDLP